MLFLYFLSWCPKGTIYRMIWKYWENINKYWIFYIIWYRPDYVTFRDAYYYMYIKAGKRRDLLRYQLHFYDFFPSKKGFMFIDIFWQKLKFWSKIEVLVKSRNFGQKSKFWSKIEILVKDRNFGQKLKFWSKIEVLVKNRNFGQKSKFWSKVEILLRWDRAPFLRVCLWKNTIYV